MQRLARASLFGALLVCFAVVPPARAQVDPDMFVSGEAAQSWELWRDAMRAVLDRGDEDAVEAAFSALLESDPSPFRLALFEERTIRHTEQGGAIILLEEDLASEALGDAGTEIVSRMLAGREQKNEADDGFYFASIGRFDVAQANFSALIDGEPDPVALLEFVDRVPARRRVLLQLADHPELGDALNRIADLLLEGERRIKADPTRIQQHIRDLAGTPREYETALERLKESGEFAVPFLLQALADPADSSFVRPVTRALPELGRSAVNPLVMALRSESPVIRRNAVITLGQIGYWQAVPYLAELRENKAVDSETRAAIEHALTTIRAFNARTPTDVAIQPGPAFYILADGYYRKHEQLAADARLAYANVWYWRDGFLFNIEVPTPIFDEVMAMRCAEETLLREPANKEALALWLAANFRREAQLPDGEEDYTRPENYPGADFFAQSAGPDYALLALARAVEDHEPAVALGLIRALRTTAGPAALLGDVNGRQPLADALEFPERIVRIRAALALAAARPEEGFTGAQNLVPVLTEAIKTHSGSLNALVIDPDDETANEIMATMRVLGYESIADATVFGGLTKARNELPGVDVILLASDVGAPGLGAGLEQIRGEFRFASTPVLLIAKPGDGDKVRTLARGDHRLGYVVPNAGDEALQAEVSTVARSAGSAPITPEMGREIALEAAEVLLGLAEMDSDVFHIDGARVALEEMLDSDVVELQLAAAKGLAHIDEPEAQRAIAERALDESAPTEFRVAMFSTLALSGRQNGDMLPADMVEALIELAEGEADLTLRTAASEAVGALNLPGDPASTIIRNQYSG